MISPYLLESYRDVFRKILAGGPVWVENLSTGKWYGIYTKVRIMKYLERFTDSEQQQITEGLHKPKEIETNEELKELNKTLGEMSSEDRDALRQFIEEGRC